MAFNPVDIIIKKREGRALSSQDIATLIDAYTHDRLPDYQMSAFLMAAFLNGLNKQETAAMTESMLHSGIVLDLSAIPGVKVDKHSTGGVGDKVSLLLAPIVAACGVPVPMISGRGLGHSGGTLDKLESIPGLRVDLDIEAYKAQLERIGIVMIGQTKEIAPADRKIYALRDVTGTVENISFIAPSIMSKKLAEGIDALVLDVKCGSGAFMKTEAEARLLAETLVAIGEQFGKPTVAWMTDMDQPLGYGIGNWPEVAESIRCLQGEWVEDLMTVTLTLAGEMLALGKAAADPQEGYAKAQAAVASGKALEKLVALVEAQGGDTRVIIDPSRFDVPAKKVEVYAPAEMSGYITAIDALKIGKLAVSLGAGRMQKEDVVDPAAGLVLEHKVGDSIEAGTLLATVYTNKSLSISNITDLVLGALKIDADPVASKPLLMGRYTQFGWN